MPKGSTKSKSKGTISKKGAKSEKVKKAHQEGGEGESNSDETKDAESKSTTDKKGKKAKSKSKGAKKKDRRSEGSNDEDPVVKKVAKSLGDKKKSTKKEEEREEEERTSLEKPKKGTKSKGKGAKGAKADTKSVPEAKKSKGKSKENIKKKKVPELDVTESITETTTTFPGPKRKGKEQLKGNKSTAGDTASAGKKGGKGESSELLTGAGSTKGKRKSKEKKGAAAAGKEGDGDTGTTTDGSSKKGRGGGDKSKGKLGGGKKTGAKAKEKKAAKEKPLDKAAKKKMEAANKLQQEHEEKERLQKEEEERIANEKKDKLELAKRPGALIQSRDIINAYDKVLMEAFLKSNADKDLDVCTSCRNIPDFSRLSEVNSYMSYWLSKMSPPKMKDFLLLTPEFLQLLSELQDFLIIPSDSMRMDLIKELGILYREMIRNYLEFMDKCSYTIISDMSEIHEPEVGICDYYLSIPQMTHCLWSNLYRVPEIKGHEFAELKLKFKIPLSLVSAPAVYRLVKLEYDPYSDSCISYFPNEVDNMLKQSILDWIEFQAGDMRGIDFRGKRGKKRKEKEKKKKKDKKKDKKKKGGRSLGGRSSIASSMFGVKEMMEKENELNLRSSAILGGIYHFNLLEIPPQPKIKGSWVTHIKEAAQGLKELHFEAEYKPPTPPAEGEKRTPEQMEKDAKVQEEELTKEPSEFDSSQDHDENEEILEEKKRREEEAREKEEAEKRFGELLGVEVVAPTTALWFEPPVPVFWSATRRAWLTEGFHDVKFNENTLALSFRTVRFGTFALSHNRWSNLPYQTWELRPIGKNKVTFSLTAAIAVLEFTVEGNLICVSSLGNVTNHSVVEAYILNKYMKPNALIKAMRCCGLDVFPELDSFNYVDGVTVKHLDTEDHLYQCMALVSSAFNFQWSRWNFLAGKDKLIYQMRERHGTASPGNYTMVLSTPRKTLKIECTEVSPNYNERAVEGIEYCADLVNLVWLVGTEEAMSIVRDADPHHIEAVRVLLSSIRPLSYS